MLRYILLSIIVLLPSLQYSLASNQYQAQPQRSTTDFQSVLSHCEKISNAFPKYKGLHKVINETRTNQINIYKLVTSKLEFGNKDLQRQINEHLNTIINRTDKVTHLKDELQSQFKVLCSLNKTLIETSTKLNTSEDTVHKLNEQLKQLKVELSESTKKLETQTLSMAQMNDTISEQSESLVELNMQTANYKTQLKENLALITKLALDVTSSKEQINTMTGQMDELKSEHSSNLESIEHLNSVIAAYTSCCQAKSCVPFGNSTNVHVITVPGVSEPFPVLCNSQLAAGNGWTVIQRRLNGSVNFYRNWSEYRKGFGDVAGEFFIGLEKLYHMTAAEPQELYIQLVDFEDESHYARYDDFQLGTEQEAYALKSLGKYSGDVENALRLNEAQKFSTFDRDNDKDAAVNCAERLHGAWWYNKCGFSNLNGLYEKGDENYDSAGQGIFWSDEDWHDIDYSLKSVQIMIRPKKL